MPPPDHDAVVALHRVTFSYAATPVLRDVSLHVKRGDFTCVIGPNGAGKTTLLRIITGYLKPRTGDVSLFGRSPRGMRERERALLAALVPQTERYTFPLSVRAMVQLGRYPHSAGLGFETSKDREKVNEAMRLAGVEAFAGRLVSSLSGGEQHRVSIARALAQDTPLILLDEPNAHLDIRHQVRLFELLRALHRNERKTIICVTHDLNLASTFADLIVLLDNGAIVACGTPTCVLRRETLSRHFGVDVRIIPCDSDRPIVVPMPTEETTAVHG
ncbi:MAG: ABC transporter ATP-binding protein [Bacteroidota bacterium]|nr:ABC transporter ATP-binding protein [Bacteroidota bacterium]